MAVDPGIQMKRKELTKTFMMISNLKNPLPIKHSNLMLFQCWATVCDAGPTLKQHWFNVSCLRCCQVYVVTGNRDLYKI